MVKNTPSERKTLTGAPINPLPSEVPYKTISLCPECTAKVEAEVLEKTVRSSWRKPVPNMVFSRTYSYRTLNTTTA